MQLLKKPLSNSLLIVLNTLLILSACNTEASFSQKNTNGNLRVKGLASYNSKDSCKKQVRKLQAFAEKNNCNTDLFFILDLEQHSGKKRFFVFDHKQDSVLASGLVAQGQGKKLSTKPSYSNVSGSYCSSKGIYTIGNSYNGTFGLAFKLYGKEASNSNAFSRFVVLHAHRCVPDKEVFPSHICQSQGCPTVSENFLIELSKYIEKSNQPILLQII